MFNMNPFEMIIIGIIALVVVGPKGLPELGRMVGKWMKTFRDAADEMKRGLYMEDDYKYRTPPRRISAEPPKVDPEPEKADLEQPVAVVSSDDAVEAEASTHDDSPPPNGDNGAAAPATVPRDRNYSDDGCD